MKREKTENFSFFLFFFNVFFFLMKGGVFSFSFIFFFYRGCGGNFLFLFSVSLLGGFSFFLCPFCRLGWSLTWSLRVKDHTQHTETKTIASALSWSLSWSVVGRHYYKYDGYFCLVNTYLDFI